ncbi:hypothetical protein, variant [Verruconis gallopava]|nr:hypothetical protein, variant [Verruconis gallopava]KIW03773.1 hypothetical protein, variant [Verruconis gallopava]
MHIDILPTVDDLADLVAVEAASPTILDAKIARDRPPWKIVVLPLKMTDEGRPSRCFVAFAYSHALGDGLSGLAFHKSFLAGLRDPTAAMYHKPAKGAMPAPFDTKKNLPISMSYLLAPALGAYLPKHFGKLFGLRAAVSTISQSTWLGSDKVFLSENHRSGVKIVRIDGTTLSHLLNRCRKHETKLTSLLHQVVVRALSASMRSDNGIDTFTSGTAINMRHHVGVSNDSMGLYVSGFFDTHRRTTDPSTTWALAREMNVRLHECSSRRNDQSIGLLRFLPSMRSWTAGHIGGKRDTSYEVSNLLAFDPDPEARSTDGARWSLGNMVFAQPANVTGGALCFNVVARKGQDLVCVISWQIGALGVGDESEERKFVDSVRTKFIDFINDLVRESFE